jgi:two-component system NarL family sensor kinase
LSAPAGGDVGVPAPALAGTVAAAAGLLGADGPAGPALDAVAGLLAAGLAADGCLVYQVAADNELVVAAAHPARPAVATGLKVGEGVTGRVAADRIPVVLVDDNPRSPVHRKLLGLRDGDLVSRLCVPARTPDGGCPAVVALHSRARRRFTGTEVAVVQQVADLVGLRLALAAASSSLATLQGEWEGLIAATVTAQESERRRIAGDLHDGVTQVIASLTFHLSAADLALSAGDLADAEAQVRAARSLADLAFAETRGAIAGLHSPVLDDLGLAAGLASMARALPDLPVDVDVEDLELPGHVENALFRVAQEALSNAARHAQAHRARLLLERHGSAVLLRVSDDGRGFDAPGQLSGLPRGRGRSHCYGLAGMYERVHLLGGQFSVTSRPGAGCVVEVLLPDVLGDAAASG